MPQQDNVNAGGVFAFAIGLIAAGIVIHLGVALLFYYLNGETGDRTREYPLAAQQETRLPPEPRLQTNPRGDLRELRDQEDRTLGGYTWVDKSGGIIRIPIDRAMQLTLERGLPARTQKEQK